MGELTGIAWTDSTMNWWEGCTKVGPGCDHCYAEARDHRFTGGAHWGPGAPRRLMSQHTRNNPSRWQRDAAAFMAEHGHPRRVFASSLADVFDNEVPDEWRAAAFTSMEATPDLRWQICTKRVSNVAKMIPFTWYDGGASAWPRNVGLLITVVTPAEIARDVPRLLELKRRFGIPWVGLSIEPMIAPVADALRQLEHFAHVDWAIFGGESGTHARDCHVAWIIDGVRACDDHGVKVFVKQLGAHVRMAGDTPYLDLQDAAGADPAEWPVGYAWYLQRRDFPAALCV